MFWHSLWTRFIWREHSMVCDDLDGFAEPGIKIESAQAARESGVELSGKMSTRGAHID